MGNKIVEEIISWFKRSACSSELAKLEGQKELISDQTNVISNLEDKLDGLRHNLELKTIESSLLRQKDFTLPPELAYSDNIYKGKRVLKWKETGTPHDKTYQLRPEAYLQTDPLLILPVASLNLSTCTNDLEKMGRIIGLVQREVKYLTDSVMHGTTEHFQLPLETWLQGCGDCDDVTHLTVALGLVAGINPSKLFAAFSQSMGHAFPVFREGSTYYVGEATLKYSAPFKPWIKSYNADWGMGCIAGGVRFKTEEEPWR